MTDDRWRRFCVVGVGGHARTKLIPALRANGQELAGVVSRRPDAAEGAPLFATVAEAVSALPEATAFLIASPPTAHFDQALTALEAGRDVIVEKPAFVTESQARRAVAAAEASGALLIEGFMNRETTTHRLFLEEWTREAPTRVVSTFTLPAVPADTFRADPAVGASNLYDVTSYVLGALIDAGADVSGVTLDGVDEAGRPDRERLHLSGLLGEVEFMAVTGVSDAYANEMRLIRADGSELAFTPFVYGRPGPRRVLRTIDGVTSEQTIDDRNAFEAMLAVPLTRWRATASQRGARMIELTRQLERLGRRLLELRP
ncbi:MAG: Gfo/Idh/MocA family oxidoreductase [Caulobacteraceae bacterium]|nr:Gfo/Idh/MocA family oxidoreductase [Caulobacteraceae bacterium]